MRFPTPHPAIPIPATRAALEAVAARLGCSPAEALARREEMIRQMEADPYRHGYQGGQHLADFRAHWAKATEFLLLGGNRSRKTTEAARLVWDTLLLHDSFAAYTKAGEPLPEGAELLERLSGTPARRVACFHTSEKSSIAIQQRAVHDLAPPEVRDMGRMGAVTNVIYNQKTGYADGFVLPNGSQCWFHNYGQYEKDPNAFEGGWYDLIILDEPFPYALLSTLRLRIGPRPTKILILFTPVDGYTPVVADFLAGAMVEKSLPATVQVDPCAPRDFEPFVSSGEVHVRGCPPGELPYVMQPPDPRRKVMFWWSQWNPFVPFTEIEAKIRNRPKAYVLTRAYGWAEKLSGTLFPAFNPKVHVVPEDQIPKEGTNFHAMDPAVARSYFMLWARVDEHGRIYVYRESPDYVTEGEWVDAEGNMGAGQKVFAGLGFDRNKQMIRRLERHDGPIYCRFGDPRFMGAKVPGQQYAMNYFELFLQPPDPMLFLPAPVQTRIEDDAAIVDDLFCYDDTRPLSAENCPKLFISAQCRNLIYCLENWHPVQGKDSPFKDPPDALRYLIKGRPHYVDAKVPQERDGEGW